MPRKSKAPTGTVEFVNKPEQAPEPTPEPSILPPKVEVPEQGDATSAPPPPVAKAKRAYKKKNGEYWEAMKGSRKEMMMKPSGANEVVHPPAPAPEPVRKVGRPKKEKAPPAPKPPKPVKEKPVKAPKAPKAEVAEAVEA